MSPGLSLSRKCPSILHEKEISPRKRRNPSLDSSSKDIKKKKKDKRDTLELMAATFESANPREFCLSTPQYWHRWYRWRSRDGTRCWPDKRHTASYIGQPCSHLHKFDLLSPKTRATCRYAPTCRPCMSYDDTTGSYFLLSGMPRFRRNKSLFSSFAHLRPSRRGLLPFSPGLLATVRLLIREGEEMCGRVSINGRWLFGCRSSKGGIEAFGGLVGITNRMVVAFL